jgi:drug/metabolite transporter (DMT)-like permease
MRVSISQLHLATFLFGLAGVIVRMTPLNILMLVEARAGLAAFALLFVATFKGVSLRVDRQQRPWFILIGLLLAFHWYSFFHSIRLSGVTVGLLTFSCFPLFVILLAPHIDKSKIRLRDLGMVAVLMLGLWLVVPKSDIGIGDLDGPLWGTASGLSFAIIQIINQKLVQTSSSIKISIYQNSVAALVLLPFLDKSMLPSSLATVMQIIFLGLFCTALAHTLFIAGMRRVSAQTASMFTYLEPVYGIGLAAFFLN